jgi:hypothetical protein
MFHDGSSSYGAREVQQLCIKIAFPFAAERINDYEVIALVKTHWPWCSRATPLRRYRADLPRVFQNTGICNPAVKSTHTVDMKARQKNVTRV